MSIPGLTDRSKSFKEIGRLRKGAAKDPTNSHWSPSDLKYFRPDFRPDEQVAAQRFYSVYGNQPTRINIRMAFPEISRCWDAFFTCYNTTGMLGQAGGVPGREGLWWIYLRDNKTGNIVVKDAFPELPFDPAVPVYSYKNKKGEDVAVFARWEGKLKVLIPELQLVNYVTLISHAWYDIARISEQLDGIAEIAGRIGLSLPLVPLVLTRRLESVPGTIGGKKVKQEKWVINIDIREDWAAAQFSLLDSIQPGALLPTPQEFPALPHGAPIEDEWEDEGDVGDIEEPEVEPVPTPEPVIEPPAALEYLYRDGQSVDMGKPREVQSFDNYLAAHNGTPPASREALRAAVLAAGTQPN